MSYIVFDIVILIVLALFLWRGASKGLVLTLCGLVAMIVALVGAAFLADCLAPKVGQALEPVFAEQIEHSLQEHFSDLPPDVELADLPLQRALDALREMGLYEELIDTVDEAISSGMTDAAAGAAAQVAAAIARSVAYMILFLVFFILILIVWAILSHALDLVTKLPGLNTLNKTGGALLGLLKGAIILFVCAWLLRMSGGLIDEEPVQKTYLLRFFMTTNPIQLITGI